MKPRAFDAAAAAELDEAVDYYEARAEGVGIDLRIEVERALIRLAGNPQLYPRVGHTGFRKCLVRRFRYAIYFLELPNYIWIAAVAHTSRRPGYWRGRRPPG